jgi:hypothetical protein
VTSAAVGGESRNDAAVGCGWRVLELFAWVERWADVPAVGLENVTASLEMQASRSTDV